MLKKNTTNSRALGQFWKIILSEKFQIILKTVLLALVLSVIAAYICTKIGILDVNWELFFIPVIAVFQIVIIGIAIRNRYKRL